MDPALIIPELDRTDHRRSYFQLQKDEHGKVIPGHLIRDDTTGKALKQDGLTLEQYFEYLDLSEDYKKLKTKFDAGSSFHELAEIVDAAAYRCVNYLGFVGFQVGEGVLIESGYYAPEKYPWDDGKSLPAYYYWVDDEKVFANKELRAKIQPEGFSHPILATSYNMWRGDFTGLNGLTGPAGAGVGWEKKIEKLRTKDVQQRVIRAVMEANLETLVKRMSTPGESRRGTLARILSTPFYKQERDEGVKITPTISGLLAGAHLRGASGLAQDLKAGHPTGSDETGTTSFDYVQRFNGYETPFDAPVDRIFHFTRNYPEVLNAGQGNLKVAFTPSHTHKEPLQIQVDLDHDEQTTLQLNGFDPKAGDKLRFLHRLSVEKIKELTKTDNTITAVPEVTRERSGSIPKGTPVVETHDGVTIKVKNVTLLIVGSTKNEVEKWVQDGMFSLSTGYPLGWGEVGHDPNKAVFIAEDVFNVHAGDFFYPDPHNSGGLSLGEFRVDSFPAKSSHENEESRKAKAHTTILSSGTYYVMFFGSNSERKLSERNFVGFAGAPEYSTYNE